MFTLNDLMDQVDLQGDITVKMMDECGNIASAITVKNSGEIPYKIGCKEIAYIYSEYEQLTVEVNE